MRGIQILNDDDVQDTVTIDYIESAARDLQDVCHGAARSSGWWNTLDALKTDMRGAKPWPELLMLMVSELGEAMEGHRKGKMG